MNSRQQIAHEQALAELAAAFENIEAAKKRLLAAVNRAYPVGTRLNITVGNNRLVGRSTGAAFTHSFHRLGHCGFINEKTSNRRTFHTGPYGHKPQALTFPEGYECPDFQPMATD